MSRLSSLGYESWIASCKEVLHLGQYFQKNTIILIDSDQKGATKSTLSNANVNTNVNTNTLQDLIELVNSRAYIARLQPHNMWLNSEFIETLIDNLQENYTSQLPTTVNFFQRHSQENNSVPYLQTVRINLPNGVKYWDIDRLQIVLQKLFSNAIASNTLELKEFKIPTLKKPLSGIQLALFI